MACFISLTENSADNPGENPEIVKDSESHLQRQLKAGERVLTQVRQEKNNLQDANVRLGVELADVRAQLADSVKENRRFRRGMYSKCLNKLQYSSARKCIKRVYICRYVDGPS